MDRVTLRKDFIPFGAETPLYKIHYDHEDLYQALVTWVQSLTDLKKIVDASGFPVHEKDQEGLVRIWLQKAECVSYRWLMQCIGKHADPIRDFEILIKMNSLEKKYEPLHFVQDLPERHEVELGDSCLLEVKARGNPHPEYLWWRCDHAGWKLIDDSSSPQGPSDSRLEIRDIEPSDCTIYTCSVKHCLKVEAEEPIHVYSKQVWITLKKGSLWMKVGSEPKTLTYSLGEKIQLKVDIVSQDPLTFNWYHDNEILSNQRKNILSIEEASFDFAGIYQCEVSNGTTSIKSAKFTVNITLPENGICHLNGIISPWDTSEEIVIIKQPRLSNPDLVHSVGEKIALSCMVKGKYPLKVEWLKQGFSSDVLASDSNNATKKTLVAYGCSITDEIPALETFQASYWRYQCCITCPRTNQQLYSDSIKVKVSTFKSSKQAMPSRKLALIISIETYDDSDFFETLKSPKNDGEALSTHLKEMDFEVMAFSNLSSSEMENVLELFSLFIDSGTFALFYFSGHALSINNDLYLAATDALPDPDNIRGFMRQSHVETRLDMCNPLLNVFIYDSCRKELPPIETRDIPKYTHTLKSGFIRAFGTRNTMEAYELMQHGVYMKHLLKHIQSDKPVSMLFGLVIQDFTKTEDQSLVTRMTPEYTSSTQQFCLKSPLRSYKVSKAMQTFFQMFRFEALKTNNKAGLKELELAMVWKEDKWTWTSSSKFHGILSISIRPSSFYNEALCRIQFRLNSSDFLVKEKVCFQLVGLDTPITQTVNLNDQHKIIAQFPAYPKKKSAIGNGDGPTLMFNGNSTETHELLLHSLQKVDKDKSAARFKCLLVSEKQREPHPGVASFDIPILTNFPGLKVNNSLIVI